MIMKRLFFTAPNLFFFYLYFFRTLTNPCIGNRQQSNQLHGLVILIIILLNIDIWLVVSNIFFSISYIYIYGMSSQPHWRTPSFFKMVSQPPTRYKVSARYQNRAHFFGHRGRCFHGEMRSQWDFCGQTMGYPLVNVYIAMENHHL